MAFENTSGLGVNNWYGPRISNPKYGAVTGLSGEKFEAVWEFTYDDLPAASTDPLVFTIPDNSYITEARFEAIEAFAGGTSYDIGLQQSDGTEIDNDGLWDALALADINAIGEWSDATNHGGTNSGTLTDAALTEAAQLVVAATGTFTAGKGRIVIEYVAPRA